jgi:hypothetical protein
MPRKPANFLRLLPALFLYALVGCSGESEEIRYRATAGVVVDGKHESAVVRETRFTSTPNSMTGFEASVGDRGEAIRVNIGEGRGAVYLLLNGLSGSREFPFIVSGCFKIDTGNNPDWIEELRKVPVGRKCTLTAGGMERIMPLFVAFRDEAVPASIFAVTPDSSRAVFGVEARFFQLTLERVSDAVPIDKGIDKHLPWLNGIPFAGSNVRVLDPTGDRNVPRDQFTLAQTVTDYYFRD